MDHRYLLTFLPLSSGFIRRLQVSRTVGHLSMEQRSEGSAALSQRPTKRDRETADCRARFINIYSKEFHKEIAEALCSIQKSKEAKRTNLQHRGATSISDLVRERIPERGAPDKGGMRARGPACALAAEHWRAAVAAAVHDNKVSKPAKSKAVACTRIPNP